LPLIRDRLGAVEGSIEEIASYLNGFTVGDGSYAAIVLGSDGAYGDSSGSSDTLSSTLDRLWLKTLRARANVIVTSGATVRTERLRQPAQDFLVASKSGDLSGLRAGDGKLLVASSVATHPSWPTHTEHLGKFASVVEVVREARGRWQNLQLEFGAHTLAELVQASLIDRLFVTAPSETAVRGHFGECVRLFDIEELSVYEVSNQRT
jgi:riboflavin biosynthesis pyrimidine reductase